MPDQLTPDQKKARRAEINRQNAQKSTGPKTEAGKATARLNGLKNGTRAVTIDLGASAGLSLVAGEDPAAYREMTAEYQLALGPDQPRRSPTSSSASSTPSGACFATCASKPSNSKPVYEEVGQIDHPGLPPPGSPSPTPSAPTASPTTPSTSAASKSKKRASSASSR
jgi:hypothetical protein